MEKKMKIGDYLAINSYWLGINIASGILTPVLMPYLVLLFMPAEQKNTYLATVRVIGLTVAMLVQPVAGMMSDRSTAKWGRRRPFIFWGAIFNVVFLFIIGSSLFFNNSNVTLPIFSSLGITTAFGVLILGTILLQFSSNIGHGALQGLIPDLVGETQRGKASGVKSVFELLPAFLVIFIGPLVDKGMIWLVIGIIMVGFLVTMLITVSYVKEKQQKEKPAGGIAEPILRLVALTVIFVSVTQIAVWLVTRSGTFLTTRGASLAVQIIVVGLAGLVGMSGSIVFGVYFGAWVGIGKEAPRQRSFIWWVVNRLLFLAAVGSIQGFAQYYLRDVLQLPNAASMTTILLAVVALFLIPSALLGGSIADRIGRKQLIMLSGLAAALGTVVLLFAVNIVLVIIGGCIIGTGAGTFMAVNWALGTDLAPKKDAGRYLGISNLAGAGAGIVGAGIGGPMADFFNLLRPGLGYIIIFSIYAALFLFSSLILTRIKIPTVGTREKVTVAPAE
jgi:MFS family permease